MADESSLPCGNQEGNHGCGAGGWLVGVEPTLWKSGGQPRPGALAAVASSYPGSWDRKSLAPGALVWVPSPSECVRVLHLFILTLFDFTSNATAQS